VRCRIGLREVEPPREVATAREEEVDAVELASSSLEGGGELDLRCSRAAGELGLGDFGEEDSESESEEESESDEESELDSSASGFEILASASESESGSESESESESEELDDDDDDGETDLLYSSITFSNFSFPASSCTGESVLFDTTSGLFLTESISIFPPLDTSSSESESDEESESDSSEDVSESDVRDEAGSRSSESDDVGPEVADDSGVGDFPLLRVAPTLIPFIGGDFSAMGVGARGGDVFGT